MAPWKKATSLRRKWPACWTSPRKPSPQTSDCAGKGDKPDARATVSFKLVEADIEKDNTKAVAGQERRFVFQGVVESDSKDHLVLGFAYLPLGKAEKQTSLNEAAAKVILAEHAKGAFTDLAAKDPSYTGSQKGGRTILGCSTDQTKSGSFRLRYTSKIIWTLFGALLI
jgi:hypothetical protein